MLWSPFWVVIKTIVIKIGVASSSSISRNHGFFVNSRSRLILVISAILPDITLKLTSFSFNIMINRENCHSRISCFTQMVKGEITFTVNSRKFWLRAITTRNVRHNQAFHFHNIWDYCATILVISWRYFAYKLGIIFTWTSSYRNSGKWPLLKIESRKEFAEDHY